MTWTVYDDAIGYNAPVLYDGMDMSVPSSGGAVPGNLQYITYRKPRKEVRTFKADEEAALIAWFMDDDAN